MLREGSIDILLTWSPNGDAETVRGDGRVGGPICTQDPRSLLATVGHPLAERDALDMDGDPLLPAPPVDPVAAGPPPLPRPDPRARSRTAPCVLVTVWQAEREAGTIRMFAPAAAELIPSLRERLVPEETEATAATR